jgi:hypothetical protein
MSNVIRQMEGYTLPKGVILWDLLGSNGDSSRAPGLRDVVRLRDANDLIVNVDINPGTANIGAGAYQVMYLRTLRDVAPQT